VNYTIGQACLMYKLIIAVTFHH